jgi:hypothetical protein
MSWTAHPARVFALLPLMFAPQDLTEPDQPAAAPEIGQPAPAHGLTDWVGAAPVEIERSSSSSQHFPVNGGRPREAEIADLAGRVVLVHVLSPDSVEATGASLRLVRDLVAANADRGIGVLTLIPQMEDAETLRDSLGIAWPVALFGDDTASPYLAPGLPRDDQLWVIDRAGFLAWAGPPSAEEKTLLRTLGALLDSPGAPPLGRPLHSALARAATAYAEGRWGEARSLAERLRSKHDGGGPEDAAIAEDARLLAEAVGEHEVALLRQALEDLERRRLFTFLGELEAMRRGFPKSDASAEVERALKDFRKGLGGGIVEDAEALREMLEKRPPLFPARVSRAGDRLRKDLEKFTKRSSNDVEPTQRARYLLERYAEAVAGQ